jgi:hypothetical protein
MQTFLADYGALIAPIAAIINGFIAVVVAQFFKDRPAAKVLLVVAAGFLGIAAIGATILTQRQIVASKTADQLRQKETRETIGGFIAKGLALTENCSDSSTPPKWEEMNAWLARMSQFLREHLGEAYVTRLTSPAGVPLNVECRGADEQHNKLFRVVNAVNFRLEQFISELSSQR